MASSKHQRQSLCFYTLFLDLHGNWAKWALPVKPKTLFGMAIALSETISLSATPLLLQEAFNPLSEPCPA